MLIKNPQRKYFKVAFLGMFSIFLSRLFYMILILSNGNDAVFSVGVFGQISGYMFFALANKGFIPHHRDRCKVCVPGLIAALIPALCFATVAVLVGKISTIITEFFYIICLCSAVYLSVSVIIEKKNDKFSAPLVPFNICVCSLVFANAIEEMILYFNIEWLNYASFGLGGIIGILIVIMLPLLKKGVDKWEV